jgi:2'-5' RNA ligase
MHLERIVTPIDYLMMDAKQVILEEQHQRFQDLHREGRWVEALQQMHVTLRCASDLLNESLRVLEETIENCQAPSSKDTGPTT